MTLQTVAYKGPGDPKSGVEAWELVETQAKVQGFCAVDTETISLVDRTCIGTGVAAGPHAVYVMLGAPYVWECVYALVRDTRITRVFHNAMFDTDSLGLGVEHLINIGDTSIMAAVQGRAAALKRLTWEVLGRVIDEISDILPSRATMLEVPFPVVAAKCLDDIRSTHDTYVNMGGGKWQMPDGHLWKDHLDQVHVVTVGMKDCYRVDLALIPLLIKMSRRGIKLRQDKLLEWKKKLGDALRVFDDQFDNLGFNPASPKQVGYILGSRGNVLPLTKSGKQLKTDKTLLEELDDPLAKMILERRAVAKLKSTYIDPWEGEDRAYSHYRLDLATARLASFDRNMQNFPWEVRNIFEPDTGIWTVADANQIEMRVFAYITQDPAMLAAYARGSDVHWETQHTLWPDSDPKDKEARRRAKTWNFARIFLAGAKTLSAKTGASLVQVQEHMLVWDQRYPKARDWLQTQAGLSDQLDYVPSIFERLIRLPWDQPGVSREHLRKCAVNYPVQNGAVEIIKRAMLRLYKMGGYDFAAQVHDEFLLDGRVDIPEDLGNVIPELSVPFEVVVGTDWAKS